MKNIKQSWRKSFTKVINHLSNKDLQIIIKNLQNPEPTVKRLQLLEDEYYAGIREEY